jgi:hypothetical protein
MAQVSTARFKQLAPRMIRDLMRDFAPLADFQAAGCVGNGGGESGGFTLAFEQNPSVSGSKGGSGFFQWTGFTQNNDRRKKWEAFLRGRGLDPNNRQHVLDYDANYSFLKHELQTSERATIPALRQTRTPEEATKMFMVKFERPGIPHFEGRVFWTKLALNAYNAEKGKMDKDPPVVGDTGKVVPNAPVDGIPKPKESAPKTFWGTISAAFVATVTAVYNFALDWLPLIVLLVGLVIVAVYVLRPVYLRWRDHLQYAPELIDAPFKAKLAVLFDGFKIKMLARLTEGVSALAALSSGASTLAGFDGLGIDNWLPAIPVGEMRITASQYLIMGGIVIGRLNDWLRERMNVPTGVVDPQLAATLAAESSYVIGNAPSPALASVVAPTVGIEQFVTHTEPARKPRKKKAKKSRRR